MREQGSGVDGRNHVSIAINFKLTRSKFGCYNIMENKHV